MSSARLLVLCKTTNWQLMRAEGELPRLRTRVQEGEATARQLLDNHRTHLMTLVRLRRFARQAGYALRMRSQIGEADAAAADLVVALGGDGTLLRASHAVGPQTPLVGINSAPEASVGYFCAAPGIALEDTLRDALGGRLKALSLARMAVHCGAQCISKRVLNDVLFANASPAIATRYRLDAPGGTEDQVSSGVWVGPPAGSTAAMLSAGGEVLPLERALLQFVVREPYLGALGAQRRLSGRVPSGAELSLTPTMRKAELYLDGLMGRYSVGIGQPVRFGVSDESLSLLGVSAALHALHARYDESCQDGA